jgi:hypothetical protein
MTVHKEQPGWVELLREILWQTEKLADPACQGRHVLFDPAEPGEHYHDVEYRRGAAVRVCETQCSTSTFKECERWFLSLPRSRRPAGVCAGRLPSDEGMAA